MFVNSDGQLKLPEGCKVIIPAVPSHTDPFSGRVLSSYWFEKYPTDAGDLTVGAGPASKAITNMYNQADIKKSVEAILKVIQLELANLGGRTENIYLGGISKGGCIALATYLQFDKRLGGVVCCNGLFCADLNWSSIDADLKS
jgi:dienelactone hydrolase